MDQGLIDMYLPKLYFHNGDMDKLMCNKAFLRAAACKDREFAVNDHILGIALILPKNPHW